MSNTRKASPSAALAAYLTDHAELALMQDTIHAELKRQQAAKTFVLFRGRPNINGIIAALADALIEAEVHDTHPGAPDDPAPFSS